ncbi:hypothetical protein K3495_g14265 [Podosphaera aphanis]|nr:hypothetical protein K3495_g14265 [Podosphaera aphanis]
MAAEENNPAEAHAFKELSTLDKNIYIQVVCPDILASLLELQNPHLMWKFLETEYERNSTFNLVNQFRNLALLASAYIPGQPISAFIKTFETEYSRLTKLARDSSDDDRKLLAQFLQSCQEPRGTLDEWCFEASAGQQILSRVTKTKGSEEVAEIRNSIGENKF